jgi:prolyl-tRNA editing enzyme YbaK/EbsC (Cys-tRNA(Pro) deacylase)
VEALAGRQPGVGPGDPSPLPAQAQRVQEALTRAGLDARVVCFAESTRTAQEAAAAVGVEVGQIVKSLVFDAAGRPVLVLTSGANRVDLSRLEALLGVPVGKANAEAVRRVTGFSIGGVPPLGHLNSIEVVMDEDLLTYPLVYAAAGTPNAVFPATPAALARAAGARVAAVKQG